MYDFLKVNVTLTNSNMLVVCFLGFTEPIKDRLRNKYIFLASQTNKSKLECVSDGVDRFRRFGIGRQSEKSGTLGHRVFQNSFSIVLLENR